MDEETIDPEIAKLIEELNQEVKQWEIANIHQGMVMVDAYLMNIKMRVVLRALEDKLGISNEDLDRIYKEETLAQLREDRKKIVKARAKQAIAVPQIRGINGIIGPNGKPLL